jgi:CrcB protein
VNAAVLVFIGAGLGGVARYAVGGWVQTASGSSFPWGTLFVNVTGSLLITALIGALEYTSASPEWRLFLGIGVLGGYTTFSTFSYGISGFGAHARMHTEKVLRLSLDLPVVVEVVASEEHINGVLPELDRMIDGGLITLERVRVIMYRPHDLEDDAKWQHRIAGLHADKHGAGK